MAVSFKCYNSNLSFNGKICAYCHAQCESHLGVETKTDNAIFPLAICSSMVKICSQTRQEVATAHFHFVPSHRALFRSLGDLAGNSFACFYSGLFSTNKHNFTPHLHK